ncbi:hypothetical protein GBA52_013924 [Prunus armeniaca]|nr:hypothetical protein GBA52_013924 [Prunus armeniaca]
MAVWTAAARQAANMARLSSPKSACTAQAASLIPSVRSSRRSSWTPPKVNFWEDPMHPFKWKQEHDATLVTISLARMFSLALSPCHQFNIGLPFKTTLDYNVISRFSRKLFYITIFNNLRVILDHISSIIVFHHFHQQRVSQAASQSASFTSASISTTALEDSFPETSLKLRKQIDKYWYYDHEEKMATWQHGNMARGFSGDNLLWNGCSR